MRATAPASFDCVRHTTPDSAQDARAGIFRSGWFGWPLLLSLLAVGSVAPDFIGGPRAALDLLRTGDLGQLTFDPVYVLTWLAALPWGPLVPLLLWAGWIGRRRAAPPAWWGLWAFAVLTTLRYVTTGYAFGGAIAPALAVLGWLYTRAPSLRGAAALKQSLASEGIASHTPLAMTPRAEEIASQTPLAMTALRLALTLLAVAAIANLAAQATGGSLYFNAPRAWVQTAVGQVAIPAIYARDATAIQTVLRESVPAGRPIVALGWGAAWYLLADRPNPTLFDIAFPGLGTTGPEAIAVRAALDRNPPLAVIGVPRTLQAAAAASPPPRGALGWWAAESMSYEDRTPADARYWAVWVRK